MRGVNNPELTKRLNEHVPKTVEEMMTATTAFIRGETVVASQKKVHTPWKSQDQSKRHTFERRSDFQNKPKDGRWSNKFTPLTLMPKEIFVAQSGKFKPPPPMLRKQIEELVRAGKLSHFIKEIRQDKDQQKTEKGRSSQRQSRNHLYDTAVAKSDATEGYSDKLKKVREQTCSITNGEKAKSGPKTWLGTTSLGLESSPEPSHSSRHKRHLASMSLTPLSLHLIKGRPDSVLLIRPHGTDDLRHKLVVPNQVLGPDLAFSPLVMIQLTDFKCGGKSVGMSWSHVLGDAFSAAGFMNLWSQVSAGHYAAQPLTMAQKQAQPPDIQSPNPSPDPLSVKRVGPVGDLWSTSNKSKMETFSYHFSSSELIQVQAKICEEKQIPVFDCICVVIWQSLAKVRDGLGPNVVTICKTHRSLLKQDWCIA
uniref:Protein eceriferum 26-like n=1 Tax=Tanacetum cinerariifolium TaxID=118510 RepID=A0A6L2JQ68_TANCI|nr:protein eceriferum 26-like [Tanacetum cinerariifolium]